MKPLTGNTLIRVLEKNGWKLARIQGSHHIFVKEGYKTRISVPVHGNQILKIGLQNHLMKIAGIKETNSL